MNIEEHRAKWAEYLSDSDRNIDEIFEMVREYESYNDDKLNELVLNPVKYVEEGKIDSAKLAAFIILEECEPSEDEFFGKLLEERAHRLEKVAEDSGFLVPRLE